MLLAIDVGNTHTVLGIFDHKRLIRHWRIQTSPKATADEFQVLMAGLFSSGGIQFQEIERTVISCVVPSMVRILAPFCAGCLGHAALWVDARSVPGMPNLYRVPAELGPDRIVNALAAYHQYRTSLIVIDFGTATTFDAVSEAGEFLGGAISPGLGIAAEALYTRAPKLPRVDIHEIPETAIGRDTATSLHSGILLGYAGLVDAMVERMRGEMGAPPPRIIATGGLSPLMKGVSKTIEAVAPTLTLEGLRLIAGFG
jgi:type III pantothenate kinase